MRKKVKEDLKKQVATQRRENFVSTITETPQQISKLNKNLYEILGEENNDIEWLKQAAKNAESLVSWWINVCDDIWFYSFQTYLIDVLGSRKPLITYIKNMSTTATKKNMKELKQLAQQCSHTTSISEAINICYHLQEKIKKDLSNPAIKPNTKFHQQEQEYNDIITSPQTSTSKAKEKTYSLGDEIFGWYDDTFEADDFIKKMVSDEEQERQDKAREKTLKIFEDKYYFNEKGMMMTKSSFDSLQEKLKRDDSFMQ